MIVSQATGAQGPERPPKCFFLGYLGYLLVGEKGRGVQEGAPVMTEPEEFLPGHMGSQN